MKRSIHSYWQTTALALLATWALGSVAVANGSFGGGTIGSNPMTQGDGGQDEIATRPMFFIEGPAELIHAGSPIAFDGAGEAFGVETGVPGLARLEFSASLNVRVAMELLADPRVDVGFRVAPRGGVTKIRWDLGPHRSRLQTAALNASVELPVTRLRRAGLLERGLVFTSFHRESGRTSHSIATDGDFLVIRPN